MRALLYCARLAAAVSEGSVLLLLDVARWICSLPTTVAACSTANMSSASKTGALLAPSIYARCNPKLCAECLRMLNHVMPEHMRLNVTFVKIHESKELACDCLLQTNFQPWPSELSRTVSDRSSRWRQASICICRDGIKKQSIRALSRLGFAGHLQGAPKSPQ